MRTSLFFFISFVVLWSHLLPTSAMSVRNYVGVPHIPEATEKITIPLPVSTLQCSKKCSSYPPCKGFIMNMAEPFPCSLVLGFTGVISKKNPGMQAYVSTEFNGVSYIWRASVFTWNKGLAFCKALGRIFPSYPTSEDLATWMKAVAYKGVFIGARKSDANPNEVYDINTNASVTIAWATGCPRNISTLKTVLLTQNGFEDINPVYGFLAGITVLCAPKE